MNDKTPVFRSRTATLATVALALTFAGCRTAPPPDDNALNSALQSKLVNDAALSAEPIQTFVQGGTATLQGAVSSEAAKALAASDASQVPGIRSVVNQLTVQMARQAAPEPAPAPIVVAPPPPVPARTQRPSTAVKRPAERRALPPVIAPAPIERRPLTPSSQSPQPDQQATQPAPAPRPATPPPPAFRNVTGPAGTTLPVRITQTLDSATTQTGDSFSGVIASDVLVDGLIAIPAGTAVKGQVDVVHEASHFKGSSLLTISLASLNRGTDRTRLTTDPLSKEGAGRGKNTAEKVGGGAAIGALLGGIFGGGSGAAIGAAAGGGLGAGANGITRGQQVQIPSETLLRFNLSNPVDLRIETRSSSESRNSRGSDTNLQPRDSN